MSASRGVGGSKKKNIWKKSASAISSVSCRISMLIEGFNEKEKAHYVESGVDDSTEKDRSDRESMSLNYSASNPHSVLDQWLAAGFTTLVVPFRRQQQSQLMRRIPTLEMSRRIIQNSTIVQYSDVCKSLERLNLLIAARLYIAKECQEKKLQSAVSLTHEWSNLVLPFICQQRALLVRREIKSSGILSYNENQNHSLTKRTNRCTQVGPLTWVSTSVIYLNAGSADEFQDCLDISALTN